MADYCITLTCTGKKISLCGLRMNPISIPCDVECLTSRYTLIDEEVEETEEILKRMFDFLD